MWPQILVTGCTLSMDWGSRLETHPDPPHKICIEHPIIGKILISECCSQEGAEVDAYGGGLRLELAVAWIDPQWHLHQIDLVAGTLTQAASGEKVER